MICATHLEISVSQQDAARVLISVASAILRSRSGVLDALSSNDENLTENVAFVLPPTDSHATLLRSVTTSLRPAPTLLNRKSLDCLNASSTATKSFCERAASLPDHNSTAVGEERPVTQPPHNTTRLRQTGHHRFLVMDGEQISTAQIHRSSDRFFGNAEESCTRQTAL
jgi:hypothetical protein